MMNGQNQAFFQAPTLAERVWRRLGFRYHLGAEPEGCDALEGKMRTDIRLRFGLADRLRLLVTGRLFIASIVHTDTPSPDVCKSRVDWMIQSPKDQRGRR
jgi:hypothetical protein